MTVVALEVAHWDPSLVQGAEEEKLEVALASADCLLQALVAHSLGMLADFLAEVVHWTVGAYCP